MLHRDDDALGTRYQIHSAPHPRHHFVRNHPVGQVSGLVHLQSAEHGEVEMPAANEAERHRAVECAGARQRRDWTAARICEGRMGHTFVGRRANSNHPVLRLEERVHAVRHVICDSVGIPMPRLTSIPDFNSRAIRRAMMSCGSIDLLMSW